MGNLYANVTLRSADTGSIVQTLTYLRRRAFVAHARSGATVVYEEAIEDDPAELGRLAVEDGFVFEHERHAELGRVG